jgi:hypothetical protein
MSLHALRRPQRRDTALHSGPVCGLWPGQIDRGEKVVFSVCRVHRSQPSTGPTSIWHPGLEESWRAIVGRTGRRVRRGAPPARHWGLQSGKRPGLPAWKCASRRPTPIESTSATVRLRTKVTKGPTAGPSAWEWCSSYRGSQRALALRQRLAPGRSCLAGAEFERGMLIDRQMRPR